MVWPGVVWIWDILDISNHLVLGWDIGTRPQSNEQLVSLVYDYLHPRTIPNLNVLSALNFSKSARGHFKKWFRRKIRRRRVAKGKIMRSFRYDHSVFYQCIPLIYYPEMLRDYEYSALCFHINQMRKNSVVRHYFTFSFYNLNFSNFCLESRNAPGILRFGKHLPITIFFFAATFYSH